MTYTYPYDSPIGRMTMTSDGTVLTGLRFDERQKAGPLPADRGEKRLPIFEETVRWLDGYFGGKAPAFIPALAPETTPFRRAVREILLTIPYGKTVTYGEIAGRLAGRPGPAGLSARAVGGAVGSNPILLIVPCHRVVGADGRLTGYAGGIDRKRRLLAHESAGQPSPRPKPALGFCEKIS